VLAKASADPTLTLPLARMLDNPSDWRLMFVEWALNKNSHLGGVASVVAHMRDRRFVVANSMDQQLAERLVSDRQFAPAILLNRVFGRPAPGVADPHFADASAHYPFGWGLVSNGSLTAERVLGGSSAVLRYGAEPGHSGQVAAQLLTLVPGRYALATRTAADASGEAPFWSVTCAEEGAAGIAQLDQPLDASATASASFEVPAGCAAQWLTLTLRPSAAATPQSGAIAWVSVTPR
jgi:hypothetical protein